MYTKILLLFLTIIYRISAVPDPNYQQTSVKASDRQSLLSYCRSFKSCHDCKKTTFHCEWCGNVGCTSFPRLHCPKKVFLDDLWKKYKNERFCTEIVTKQPIFVPADVRRFIKLDLKVDDLTLYERKVICEIQIEQKIIQVPASFDDETAYCDTAILKINKNVALGYLRLNWGGIEPYSNSVLLLVYSCQNLAQNCKDCLKLNKEYGCGWCKEQSSCSLVEECPRQYEPWLNKSFTCGNFKNDNNLRTEVNSYFH